MNRNKQQGGALMISMVLIFMMSIMGVSSMRSATLEKRMAANSVHKSVVLQAAESATELAIGKRWNLEQALDKNGVEHQATVNLNDNTALSLGAVVEFKGKGPPLGFGLGVGSGFVAYRYETTGGAQLSSIQAESVVVQGAYHIAPDPSI